MKQIEIKLNTVPSLQAVFGNEALKSIFKAISAESDIEITTQDVISYLKIEQRCYPSLYHFAFNENVGGTSLSLDISNDEGKTFPVTLIWKEIFELTEEQANVKIQSNLS